MPDAHPVLVAVLLKAWGLFGEGSVPALQVRAVTLACPGGELAQALPASAATEPARPESAEKPALEADAA